MSEETRNTEQLPTDSTPEESGGPGAERMFTQEEVNRIVSERLAREREKGTPSEADQREKALAAREAVLACREYVSAQGYPEGLLEVLDTSDADKFKAAIKKLLQLFPVIDPARPKPARFTSPTGKLEDKERDEFREAFKLN